MKPLSLGDINTHRSPWKLHGTLPRHRRRNGPWRSAQTKRKLRNVQLFVVWIINVRLMKIRVWTINGLYWN